MSDLALLGWWLLVGAVCSATACFVLGPSLSTKKRRPDPVLIASHARTTALTTRIIELGTLDDLESFKTMFVVELQSIVALEAAGVRNPDAAWRIAVVKSDLSRLEERIAVLRCRSK